MIKNFVILYVCFLLIETLISVVLSLIYEALNRYGSYLYNSINVPIGLNLWRLMFYYLPLTILFFVLFKYFNRLGISYKPVVFSIFNVLVFVGLNFLYKPMDLPSFEINEFLFWITCISIIISPIVLGKIPYFKRLMESF